MLLGRRLDFIDGPGGSEATGGIAADAHGNLAALAGLRVAQGEACAVSRRCDGTALAGDPVVLADNAEGIGAVGEIGRQLVQKRAGAEDLGCEIDGKSSGWRALRCGGWASASTEAGAGAGIWSQAEAGTDSMTGANSSVVFGLIVESAGFTVTGASAASVSTSTCVALSFSTLDFASMGVDAMVVMPALAFSGS